jgi:hypothetical protein
VNASPKASPLTDYDELAAQLDKADPADAHSAIVNVPFNNELDMALLFLGFICIFVVEEKLDRICLKAASDTEQYHLAIDHFKFDPSKYHLYFDKNKDNSIVRAILSNEPQNTTDWNTLNRGKTPSDTVRLNQANSGIAYSVIRPFRSKIRGALLFNFYQYPEQIGQQQENFMERYTELASKYLAKL